MRKTFGQQDKAKFLGGIVLVSSLGPNFVVLIAKVHNQTKKFDLRISVFHPSSLSSSSKMEIQAFK